MPQLSPETVARFRPLAELVPAHWTTGSAAALDGTTLQWTETGGDAPAVVLLHGVQVSGLNWLRTAQALESRHRVVMPDFRGHGLSGRLHTAAPSDVLVADVRTVMDTLGVRQPIVVGHSMGADVAGRLAAVDDLCGVVLVDPALQNYAAAMAFDVDTPPPWMRSLFDTLGALKTQSHEERMVAGLNLLPPGPPPDWDEADYVSLVEGQAQFDLNLYRYMDANEKILAESPHVIAAVACPILLMTGRSMMPGFDLDAAAEAFTRHWRDGRHVHVPDSGHAIMFDQFDRFIAVLTDFIEQHSDA